MDMGDADTRSRLWAALGSQPGVSAWYAVWLLSRLSPPVPKEARTPAAAAVPDHRPGRRVRAGTSPHQEQPRP